MMTKTVVSRVNINDRSKVMKENGEDMSRMINHRVWVVAALVGCLAVPALAQDGGGVPDAAVEQSAVLAEIQEMSMFLAQLDRFAVRAEVAIDEVLLDGQKIQFSKRVEIRADPPTKLWAVSESKLANLEYFYDGETFTLYTRGVRFYASFPAPPTIRETLEVAENKYDVTWPLADLFLWGSDQDAIQAVEKAIYVGLDEVGGVTCDHYALRQEDVDWQICIQRGGEPLPLKLVITSISEEEQPQLVATMKWDTAPDLRRQRFTFEPREGDYRIDIAAIDEDEKKADEEE